MLAEILSRYKTGSSLIFTVTICLSCLIWKSNLLSRTANSASQALDFLFRHVYLVWQRHVPFCRQLWYIRSSALERDALREKVKSNLDTQVELDAACAKRTRSCASFCSCRR
jgi:hypothetical protein